MIEYGKNIPVVKVDYSGVIGDWPRHNPQNPNLNEKILSFAQEVHTATENNTPTKLVFVQRELSANRGITDRILGNGHHFSAHIVDEDGEKEIEITEDNPSVLGLAVSSYVSGADYRIVYHHNPGTSTINKREIKQFKFGLKNPEAVISELERLHQRQLKSGNLYNSKNPELFGTARLGLL